MAIHISGQKCELREVLLRDKPPSMLEYSAKGTVPVLILQDGNVIDDAVWQKITPITELLISLASSEKNYLYCHKYHRWRERFSFVL